MDRSASTGEVTKKQTIKTYVKNILTQHTSDGQSPGDTTRSEMTIESNPSAFRRYRTRPTSDERQDPPVAEEVRRQRGLRVYFFLSSLVGRSG